MIVKPSAVLGMGSMGAFCLLESALTSLMIAPLEGVLFPICGRGAIPLPDAVETYSGYNRPVIR